MRAKTVVWVAAVAAGFWVTAPGMARQSEFPPQQVAPVQPEFQPDPNAPKKENTGAAPIRLARPEVWQGDVEVGTEKLELIVRFAMGPDGQGVLATLDIPAQGVAAAKLSGIVHDDSQIGFDFTPGAEQAKAVVLAKREAENPSIAKGEMQQFGQRFPVTFRLLGEGEEPSGPKRPQTPKPPFPYAERQVEYPGGDEGVVLAGTLTLPQSPGTHPAVLLITGSGSQDRDETLFAHKPFLVLADQLTRAGVAVLRVDDRGIGGSTGASADLTTDNFVRDVMAGVAFLKKQPEIDGAKIGLIGHSEGGVIAPIVASQSKDVAFVVLLAGTGTTGEQVLHDQLEAILRASGVPEDVIARQSTAQAKLLRDVVENAPDDVMRGHLLELMQEQMGGAGAEPPPQAVVDTQMRAMKSPWMRRFLTLDPRESLAKVTVPVLALNGTLDTQVIASKNLPEIERALVKGGNTDVTALGVVGLNHLFQNAKTGAPNEYAQIEETFAPAALEQITTWVCKHTGIEPPKESKTQSP